MSTSRWEVDNTSTGNRSFAIQYAIPEKEKRSVFMCQYVEKHDKNYGKIQYSSRCTSLDEVYDIDSCSSGQRLGICEYALQGADRALQP